MHQNSEEIVPNQRRTSQERSNTDRVEEGQQVTREHNQEPAAICPLEEAHSLPADQEQENLESDQQQAHEMVEEHAKDGPEEEASLPEVASAEEQKAADALQEQRSEEKAQAKLERQQRRLALKEMRRCCTFLSKQWESIIMPISWGQE